MVWNVELEIQQDKYLNLTTNKSYPNYQGIQESNQSRHWYAPLAIGIIDFRL